MPFDYAEELLSNPNNIELQIEKRQSAGSATGEKHPNTSSDLPFSDSKITQDRENVNYSLNELTDDGLTMTYVRVPNQNMQNYGSTYGQNIEPAGEYMNMDTMRKLCCRTLAASVSINGESMWIPEKQQQDGMGKGEGESSPLFFVVLNRGCHSLPAVPTPQPKQWR